MRFTTVLKKTLETLLTISALAAASGAREETQETQTQKQEAYGKAEIYRPKIQLINGKPVIEINEYLMGKGILGVCNTYSGAIHILEGLKGDDREKVIEHELGHREFPMRSEAENRRKTYTEEPNMHPLVSYVG